MPLTITWSQPKITIKLPTSPATRITITIPKKGIKIERLPGRTALDVSTDSPPLKAEVRARYHARTRDEDAPLCERCGMRGLYPLGAAHWSDDPTEIVEQWCWPCRQTTFVEQVCQTRADKARQIDERTAFIRDPRPHWDVAVYGRIYTGVTLEEQARRAHGSGTTKVTKITIPSKAALVIKVKKGKS